jgi:enoyl-CoA hydratase
MAEALVELTREGQLAWLTLQRPDKLNALSPELLAQATAVVRQVAADEGICCLVLRGSGRAFCAGADVGAMRDRDSAQSMRHFGDGGLWQAVEDLPQPTIAAVHGICFGGGCELALACDFRLAADNARFGQPEIKLGVIPGAGGTQRLPRLVGMTRAKELVFLGEPIDAAEAYRIGLVNRVVPAEGLTDEARRWATQLSQLPPLALRTAKRVMNRGRDLGLPTALELERQGFSLLFGTADQKEGMRAFLEKRPAHFEGR